MHALPESDLIADELTGLSPDLSSMDNAALIVYGESMHTLSNRDVIMYTAEVNRRTLKLVTFVADEVGPMMEAIESSPLAKMFGMGKGKR